jgi:hypothetical protein
MPIGGANPTGGVAGGLAQVAAPVVEELSGREVALDDWPSHLASHWLTQTGSELQVVSQASKQAARLLETFELEADSVVTGELPVAVTTVSDEAEIVETEVLTEDDRTLDMLVIVTTDALENREVDPLDAGSQRPCVVSVESVLLQLMPPALTAATQPEKPGAAVPIAWQHASRAAQSELLAVVRLVLLPPASRFGDSSVTCPPQAANTTAPSKRCPPLLTVGHDSA